MGDALGHLQGGTQALAVAMGMEEQEQQMNWFPAENKGLVPMLRTTESKQSKMTVMFRVGVYFLLGA